MGITERKFFTTAEATEKPFLFISYSHKNEEMVIPWIHYLIDQGVRVWWDKAFKGGDDWETIAVQLLSHDHCRGVLFFCSQEAIESGNVAIEWRAAAHTKASRPPEEFYAQIIMVTDDPNFNYKYLTSYIRKTEELYSDDDYDDFRNLFGKKDPIYYCAWQEADKQKLLDNINVVTPQAVDEKTIKHEKLVDMTNPNKEVVVKLGSYGPEKEPVLWRQINDPEQQEVILLCQDVLADGLGDRAANEWLQQFIREAFSAAEQKALQGSVRLLTTAEAAAVPQAELAAGQLWWLADCDGNLQAVVREDGTIYRNGYNNKLYKKGIRPVIAMDINKLYAILEKQN